MCGRPAPSTLSDRARECKPTPAVAGPPQDEPPLPLGVEPTEQGEPLALNEVKVKLTLYSFFRSSASHRVRIALNLKGLPYDMKHVHLDKEGGQNFKAWYRAINPHERVPALLVEDAGRQEIVIQSMAILEWIEEVFPQTPLLPKDLIARARRR